MAKNRQYDALMEAADLGLLYYGQVKPLLHFLEQRERRNSGSAALVKNLLWAMSALIFLAGLGSLTYFATQKWGNTFLSLEVSDFLYQREYVLIFGLLCLVGAVSCDLFGLLKRDLALYLYIVGLSGLLFGLYWAPVNSITGKLSQIPIYCGMILFSAALHRRSVAIFGLTGLSLVVADLAWGIFHTGVALLGALGFCTFLFLVFGIFWHQFELKISRQLLPFLPKGLQHNLMWHH
ncbi:MAG: hypothetical protein K2P84_14090 [Undibacterium sp.]|nr:hypothetical protein [Undibacterium sp.]